MHNVIWDQEEVNYLDVSRIASITNIINFGVDIGYY